MLGVDTPELKGPDREKALAATAFTEAWLAKGNFTIETCGRYHLGRLLAKVSRDGVTLGVELLTSENARDRGK